MTWLDEEGNIHHVKGDDFELRLTDFKEDDVLINWTDWSILIQAREKSTSPDKVVEFTNSDMDLTTPGVMIISKVNTAFNFTAKTYQCDWQFTRPNGKVDTLLSSKKFFLHEDISR